MSDSLHPRLRDYAILVEAVRQVDLTVSDQIKRHLPFEALVFERDRLLARLDLLEADINGE